MKVELKLLLVVWLAVLVVCAPGLAATSAQILLNEAASVGAGSPITLPNSDDSHTWHTVLTGSPTSVSVSLEGSIDGTNWFTLDTSTSTSNEMRHVVNKPVIYVRANVTTLSGGSSPTITVKYIQNK